LGRPGRRVRRRKERGRTGGGGEGQKSEVRGLGRERGGMGKSGKKTDKNGDFPCFFGRAVVEKGDAYVVLRIAGEGG